MYTKFVITICILLSGSIYYGLDRHLYYFGESIFDHNLLPMDIKPENSPDFEKGFSLNDNNEFTLIGSGFRYQNFDSITVDKIVTYGFSADRIIIKIIDLKGDHYFIEFTNKNSGNNLDFLVSLVSEDKISNLKNLQWIDVLFNEDFKKVIVVRNWLSLVLIGLSISFIVLVFRK